MKIAKGATPISASRLPNNRRPQTGASADGPGQPPMSCVPYMLPQPAGARRTPATCTASGSACGTAPRSVPEAAEPHAQRDDAHVLDAVVGEQALGVVLEDDERRRDEDRHDAEDRPAAPAPSRRCRSPPRPAARSAGCSRARRSAGTRRRPPRPAPAPGCARRAASCASAPGPALVP